MAPDAAASMTPRPDRESKGHAAPMAGTRRIDARWKLPAVVAAGSPARLPTIEYPPQAAPAANMSAAPTGSGAVNPGESR